MNSDGTWQAVVTITVVDENGNPVEGARLRDGWVGVVVREETEVQTDAAGTVRLTSTPTTRSGELTFCVTSVTYGRYTYDKSANDRNWGEIEH